MPAAHDLTPVQHQALTLLSTGSTATAAARCLGLHRNTVGNWMRSSLFREALAQARRKHNQDWRDQAQSLVPRAIDAIQAVLADPQAPAAVRLQAALAIRGSQATPPPTPRPAAHTGRNQPCPCGSGRKFKRCCMSTH